MKKPVSIAEAFGHVPVAVSASRMNARYGSPKPYGTSGRVAIVSISGPLAKEPTIFEQIFDGVTGYSDIEDQIAEAVSDQEVWGVLIRMNSPGGQVSGMFRTARFIAEQAKIKPVRVALDDIACSAAYLLASAANMIYLPRETGICGSIGIFTEHIDQSKFDEELGLKFTQVFEGDRKGDFNPHHPLSEEARSDLKSTVSRLYGYFVDDVAANRSIREGA